MILKSQQITSVSSAVTHVLFWRLGAEHRLYVRLSTIHRASVLGQFPPRFDNVFSSVMYVPPTAGSLTLAKKAITATYIL
jgi:hypothetical protein